VTETHLGKNFFPKIKEVILDTNSEKSKLGTPKSTKTEKKNFGAWGGEQKKHKRSLEEEKCHPIDNKTQRGICAISKRKRGKPSKTV